MTSTDTIKTGTKAKRGAFKEHAGDRKEKGVRGLARTAPTKTVRNTFDLGMIVSMAREGVQADKLTEIAKLMQMSRKDIYKSLAIPQSTADRLIKNQERLSPEHSERVLGMQELVQLAERIIKESGTSKGFDAWAWVGEWIHQPNPALGGTPASYMDTIAGQTIVKNLLLQAQAGVFA